MSSVRRSITSGATCTCRSYAPCIASHALSVTGVAVVLAVLITTFLFAAAKSSTQSDFHVMWTALTLSRHLLNIVRVIREPKYADCSLRASRLFLVSDISD